MTSKSSKIYTGPCRSIRTPQPQPQTATRPAEAAGGAAVAAGFIQFLWKCMFVTVSFNLRPLKILPRPGRSGPGAALRRGPGVRAVRQGGRLLPRHHQLGWGAAIAHAGRGAAHEPLPPKKTITHTRTHAPPPPPRYHTHAPHTFPVPPAACCPNMFSTHCLPRGVLFYPRQQQLITRS